MNVVILTRVPDVENHVVPLAWGREQSQGQRLDLHPT